LLFQPHFDVPVASRHEFCRDEFCGRLSSSIPGSAIMVTRNDAAQKNLFSAALALPATIVRGLLHIPTAIVNVMERHGAGK
jgi:hypothetical protein